MVSSPRFFKGRDKLPPNTYLVDILKELLEELFFVEHPRYKDFSLRSHEGQKFVKRKRKSALWVYYPWHKTAILIPSADDYFILRTARNRNIITELEQSNYSDIKAGIAGLSVGSSVLFSLVLSGGPRVMKIADSDIIAGSNLNRINATLFDVGINKANVAAHRAWEIDPYLKLDVWNNGISKENIDMFLLEKPKIDIFIDAMDDFSLKVKSRIICRQERIPVIMATDIGDSILLDVERFDIDKERPLFHGIIPDIENLDLSNLSESQWLSLAIKILNPYISQRMQHSIGEIGKTIAGIPQLGTSANVAGSIVAYAVRKIANNQKMPSGRYIINFDEIFGS